MTKDWLASDNGFSSVEAMNLAHKPILDYAVQVLSEEGGTEAGIVAKII